MMAMMSSGCGGRTFFYKKGSPPATPSPKNLNEKPRFARFFKNSFFEKGFGGKLFLQKKFSPKALKESSKGFTLLELTVALALWAILSMGVFFVWQHAANAGADMMEQQYAFENARITMDALLMNLQLARQVEIGTDGDMLRTLYATQLETAIATNVYEIHFIAHDEIVTIGQRNAANTFATNIAAVRLEYLHGNRMRVTVVSACNEPITLTGSVCVLGTTVIFR